MAQQRNFIATTVASALLVGWLGTLSSHAVAGDLKPFTSDGCSAFPDGTLDEQTLWLDCCTAHDFAYWQGGTKLERKAADKHLQMCVAKVGKPKVALLMLAGVRVGGSPLWPTQFRWGYGWPYFRWYSALTPEELAQVKVLRATAQ